MSKKLYSLSIVAAITLSGCGLPDTFYIDSFLNENITGNDFNSHLAKAYQERTFNSMDADANGILAGMYTRKGMAALSGDNVQAWDHNVYNEHPTFRVGVPQDRAQKYNLDTLKSELNAALDNGGRTRNPHACAQAQARYDWLVDETFQDTPPAQIDEEDKIYADLQRYITACKGQTAKKVQPAPATEWIVYFGWDKFNLTSEAQRVIDSVVHSAKHFAGKALSVVGYTDTSGNRAYNNKLSQKRAANVASSLRNKGLNSIHTESRGESSLAKQTLDGIREPLNRRVTITFK